jgi:hypothetical protein
MGVPDNRQRTSQVICDQALRDTVRPAFRYMLR